MAKKKRMGKTSTTSQGTRRSSKGCRTLTPMQRLINQQEAWLKGKRVMLVVDAAGTKREARHVWGLPPHERRKAKSNDS